MSTATSDETISSSTTVSHSREGLIRTHSLSFLIETSIEAIEEVFRDLTTRKDMAILLISQQVANRIRHLIEGYTEMFPTILEIPSKDHPWDPEQDTVLRKVNRLFSGE